MKKLLSLLLCSIIVLAGCSTQPKSKLQIYTSFSLITDLTKKIVGDKAEIKPIVENNEEAHEYELSTKKLAEISKANVVIYNGLGLEEWIDKVKEASKNTSFIDTSVGIEVLKGHDHEGHDHEGEHKHEHDHEYNPHIWMSIKNAIIQMKNIKDQMVKIDPSNAEYYENNFKKYSQELTTLEAEYAKSLNDVKRKTIVVAHAAYTYLTEDYGLEEHSISGFSPEADPSLAKLVELSKLVKDENVTTIFFDENVSSKVSDVLAKEANVKTAVLYSLEKIGDNEDYISLMRKNLNALVKALNE